MDPQRPLSIGRLYRAIAQTIRQAVGAILTVAQWEGGGSQLGQAFRDTPRRRQSQAAQACRFIHQHATASSLC